MYVPFIFFYKMEWLIAQNILFVRYLFSATTIYPSKRLNGCIPVNDTFLHPNPNIRV